MYFFFLTSVKPSPSKKSRSGAQGGLRRAPTLGGPTPLSQATGQSSIDSRLVYHSHFRSTDSEADGGENAKQTLIHTSTTTVLHAVVALQFDIVI